MEIKYQINSRILLFSFLGMIMTCMSYLMFMYDPLQMIISRVATLREGSIFVKLWADPPYDVFIDVYIFNVTNSEAFLRGEEKLNLVEVGPYVYQELLTNTNATFFDNGTMTFLPRRDLRFRPELSSGDPQSDYIISPNIPLIGISASFQDSWMKNMAVASFATMIGAKAFVNVTVHQYLWGYEDPLVTYANKFIPSWINFNRFGIMERLMALDNASNVVTLNTDPTRVKSSPILTKDEQDAVYHIHTWNGSPGLEQWGYVNSPRNETPATNSRCNLVEGSFEGTVFPPNFKENATFKMYRRAFCRPVPFNYDKKVISRDGFDGVRFQVDELFLANPDENPDNACYCYKGKCLRKGLGSLAPCYYDIPIDISQPHFYNSDPSLLNQVEGMKPNRELHDSSFVLHPQLGVPIEANLRIQINLDVGQTKYSSTTRPFNGLTLPLFWLQMRITELPGSVKLLITMCYHVLPVVEQILIYLLGLGGLALISGSALFALFFSTREVNNGRLSFRSSYSPIPIIPINSPYFKPEIRILK